MLTSGDRNDIKDKFYGNDKDPDSKISFKSKGEFIKKLEDEYNEEEGKDPIIRSAMLRNTLNKNAKQRTTEILGDQINVTEGSHKMAAINGDVKIDMTDQGIYIDAGEGRDVTIKCRKFHLKNEDEDNITYGDDYAAHFGSNEEYFYGKSDEYFYGDKYEEHHGTADEHFRGDKLETFHGSSGEWYMGHKIEGFLGGKESLSLANNFEVFAGFKEEISLSIALTIGASLSLVNKVFEYEMKGLHIQKTGLEMENRLTKIETGQAEIANKLMVVHSGMKIHA